MPFCSSCQDPPEYWVSLLRPPPDLQNLRARGVSGARIAATDSRSPLQDKCVWPAYLRAHSPLFQKGDVESGSVDPSAIEGVELLEAKELGMEAMVVRACERIYEAVKSGKGREQWTKP